MSSPATLKFNSETEKYEIIVDGQLVHRVKNKKSIREILSYNVALQKLGISEILDEETGETIRKYKNFSELTDAEKEVFKTELEKCGEIRYELNEVLHKKMSNIAKAFSMAFSKTPSIYKLIKDTKYYTGGYPNENTPPRLESITRMIAEIVHGFKYIGQLDEVNTYLKNYGITIDIEKSEYDTMPLYKNIVDSDKKMKKNFYACASDALEGQFPETNSELFKKLLEIGLSLQKEICEKADLIKVDSATSIEENLGISKACFINAVKKAAIKIKKGKLETKDFKSQFSQIQDNQNVLEVYAGQTDEQMLDVAK